ncbi:hypothetical protein Tco_1557917, partial [Tanacetum coccineum]
MAGFDTGNTTHELLVKILSKLGNLGLTGSSSLGNSNVIGTHKSTVNIPKPVVFQPNIPNSYVQYATGPGLLPPGFVQHSVQPNTFYTGPSIIPTSYAPHQVFQPVMYMNQPTQPARPAGYQFVQPAQTGPTTAPLGTMGPTVRSGQETTLPHAFVVGTLHDPSSGAWNMDTGASSHLNDSVT